MDYHILSTYNTTYWPMAKVYLFVSVVWGPLRKVVLQLDIYAEMECLANCRCGDKTKNCLLVEIAWIAKTPTCV